MNQDALTRHIGHLTLAVSIVCGATDVLAAPEAQFQSAFAHFIQASSGDMGSITQAADAFTSLLAAEPANPVLMAYAGSATAMKATTTMMPWKKMAFAEDGLAQLDKALALLGPAHDAPVQHGTPGVLEVKFVASNTFLAVPGFMNRNERGAKLLGDVVAHPLLAAAPLAFKGSVWLSAAKEANKAKNTAEAKRFLDLVVQQQAPQSAQAQAMLKSLSAS